MIISKTPTRLGLLGGNTDFPAYFKKYGGAVLTTTINKYLYCIITKRFDDMIYINYSIKEKVNNIKDIKHNLTREAMKLTKVTKGIEITFLSDIPSEGSGLGSSSAVVVGVLNALHNYRGEAVTAQQLAEEACHIEIDILKKPIGVQDQYAVAFGGCNLIEFGKKIAVQPVNPFNIEDYLMLFYTGKTRKADKILSQMKLNKKILDRNKMLAYLGVTNLEDPVNFGELLNEYWNLKKELNPLVSDDLIDKAYEKALYNGALGGKIVGAGGGGFLLLIVPVEYRQIIREQMGMKELPIRLSKYGSRIIFQNE